MMMFLLRHVHFNSLTIFKKNIIVVFKYILVWVYKVLFSITDIVWMGPRGEESFYDLITSDENIQDMMSQLQTVVQGE